MALELPETIRQALIGWGVQALRGTDGIRLLATEGLHVTLCFLGWRSPEEIDAIKAGCAVLAGAAEPELELGPPRWLPRRQPRVLAVELGDQGGRLVRAQARLSETLAAGGWYRPENRPFLPHVTVARVGRGARAPRKTLATPPGLGFRASRVTLYRSRLMRSGARYEALAGVELAG